MIDKERRGEFLGKTVQVIPHITDEIKRRFKLLTVDKKCRRCYGTAGNSFYMHISDGKNSVHYGNILICRSGAGTGSRQQSNRLLG